MKTFQQIESRTGLWFVAGRSSRRRGRYECGLMLDGDRHCWLASAGCYPGFWVGVGWLAKGRRARR